VAEFDLEPVEGFGIPRAPEGMGIPRGAGRRDPGRGMPVPAGRANREPVADGGLRPEPAAGRPAAGPGPA